MRGCGREEGEEVDVEEEGGGKMYIEGERGEENVRL